MIKQNKNQSDYTSKNKVNFYRGSIAVIEGEWFADMNSTDGETFLVALITSSKTRANQKIDFTCDTKRLIQEIANKMVGTHNLSKYCVRYMMEN